MSQTTVPKTELSPEEVKQLAEGKLRMMDILGVQPAELKVKMDEALEHVQAGRYGDARVIFKGLEALDRQNPLFPTALSSMEMLLKNYPAALDYAEKAIECEEGFVQAYYLLGEAQAQLKNNEEAMEAFEKAFELAPRDEGRDARRCRAIYSNLKGSPSGSSRPARVAKPVTAGPSRARAVVPPSTRSAPQPVAAGRRPQPATFAGRGAAPVNFAGRGAAPVSMRPTPMAPPRPVAAASPRPVPVGRPVPRPTSGGAPRPVAMGRGGFSPMMISRAGRTT